MKMLRNRCGRSGTVVVKTNPGWVRSQRRLDDVLKTIALRRLDATREDEVLKSLLVLGEGERREGSGVLSLSWVLDLKTCCRWQGE